MFLDIWEIIIRLDLYQIVTPVQDMTAKDYYDAKPAWCLVEKFDFNFNGCFNEHLAYTSLLWS